METNYFSSLATSDPKSESRPLPNTKLATYSLVLVILLDFTPIGTDILVAAYFSKSLLTYAILALVFAALILSPLAVIVRRDGFRGLSVAPIRVTITVLLVVFRSVTDIYMIWQPTHS